MLDVKVAAGNQRLGGSQLVELFGQTRDEWMKADINEWLQMNAFYPNAPELLQHAMAAHETYIVTTKQVSADNLLMQEYTC